MKTSALLPFAPASLVPWGPGLPVFSVPPERGLGCQLGQAEEARQTWGTCLGWLGAWISVENTGCRHGIPSPLCCHSTRALVGKTVTEQASWWLADPTLAELGMGSPGQEAWGLGTTLSFPAPPVRLWPYRFFCPFPAHAEWTVMVPSALCTRSTLLAYLGSPCLPERAPTAHSGGGARDLHFLHFLPTCLPNLALD